MALHFIAESAFDDLLACWRHHNDVRRKAEPTIAELGHTRVKLDEARTRMNRIRLAMYPNADEATSAQTGVLCPVLDEFVYLNRTQHWDRETRQLQCLCGELVSDNSLAKI